MGAAPPKAYHNTQTKIGNCIWSFARSLCNF